MPDEPIQPQQGASYSANLPTANEQLLDSAIYHGLSLERVSAGMSDKIRALLQQAQEEITGKLQGGQLTDWQTKRAQQFLEWSKKTIANTYGKIDNQTQEDLDGIKKAEIQKQINSVNSAVGVEISPAMSEQQISSIAKADELLVNGATMKDWWAKQASNLQHQITTTVQGGLVQGKSTQDIASEIRKFMPTGEDVSVKQAVAQAQALARTAVATVQSEAQKKYYEQNDDIIKGIKWVSTLDSRTTPMCMALDGKTWKYDAKSKDYEPVGHTIPWPDYPPIHWNCRSTTVPVLKSWHELSKKELPHKPEVTAEEAFTQALKEQGFSDEEIAQIEANQRASVDGGVPDTVTYEEWLKKQPEAMQKSILGPGKWQLWQDGSVSLEDMINKQTLEPLTVQELQAAAKDNKAIPPPPPPPDGMHGLSLAERQILTAQMTSEAVSGETWASWFNPDNGMRIDQTLKHSLTADEAAQLAAQDNLIHLSNTASNNQFWTEGDAKLWAGQDGFAGAKMVTPSGRVITAKLKSGASWTLADADKYAAGLREAELRGMDDQFRAQQYAFGKTGKVILTQTEPGAVKLDSSTMKKVYGPVHVEDKPLSFLEAHANQEQLAADAELRAQQQAIKDQMQKADEAQQAYAEESQKAREAQAKLQTKIAQRDLEAAQQAQKEASDTLAAHQKELDEAKAAHEEQLANEAAAARAKLKADDELWAAQQAQKEAEDLQAKLEKKKKASEAAKKGAATKAAKKKMEAELAAAEAKDKAEALLAEQAQTYQAVRRIGLAEDALAAEEASKQQADKIYAQQQADLKAKQAQEAAVKAQQAAAAKAAAAPVNTHGQMDLVFEPKAEAKTNFPADPMQLKVAQRLGGSTGAELVEDADGNKYVRKKDTNKGQINDEFLADELYRALGIKTPEGKLYSTPQGPVKLTKLIEGGKELSEYLRTASQAERDQVMTQIQRSFVPSAWMANWDVAGLTLDNILVDPNGDAWLIDNGGSLRFRGMGSKKTAAQFGDTVGELQTLRTAPQAGQLYKNITPQQIVDQSVKMYMQRDKLLSMIPAELRAKMAARMDDIDRYASELVADGKAKMPVLGKPMAVPPEPKPPKVELTVKGFPKDPMALKHVEDYPVGNGTGAVVEDAAGNKYLRRTGGDALIDESRAAEFFGKMGVKVPDHELFTVEGKPVMLQKFVGGQKIDEFMASATDAEKKKLQQIASKHFALDALTGNMHVADGLRITRDKAGKIEVHRVDNSGVFRYAVTGAPKLTQAWDAGHGVSELWTMRSREAPHAAMAPSLHTQDLFKHLDIVDVSKLLRELPPEPVTTGDPEIDKVLKKRWQNMRQLAEGTLDADHFDLKTDFLEHQSAQRGNFKQMGLSDRIADVDLSNYKLDSSQHVHLYDQNGKDYDDLRSTTGSARTVAPPPAPGTVPGDVYYSQILDAAKTINHHMADQLPNMTKVNAALALKPQLEALLLSGDMHQINMADKYIMALENIENMKASGTYTPIPQFQQYKFSVAGAPTPPPVHINPTASIPSIVRDEINRQYGNRAFDMINTWASQQGGDSQNAEPLAMRSLWSLIRNVDPKDSYWTNRGTMSLAVRKQKVADYANRFGLSATEAEKVYGIWHGFIQETLSQMDLPANDMDNRVIRLVRAQSHMDIIKTNPDGSMMLRKGSFDSHSLVKWAWGSPNGTVQAVPHSLVHGIWAMEKRIGMGGSFFLGDGENEVAADTQGIAIKHIGHTSGGEVGNAVPDATKWGVPIDHLRPDDGSLD